MNAAVGALSTCQHDALAAEAGRVSLSVRQLPNCEPQCLLKARGSQRAESRCLLKTRSLMTHVVTCVQQFLVTVGRRTFRRWKRNVDYRTPNVTRKCDIFLLPLRDRLSH
jgi:hypothetical protein